MQLKDSLIFLHANWNSQTFNWKWKVWNWIELELGQLSFDNTQPMALTASPLCVFTDVKFIFSWQHSIFYLNKEDQIMASSGLDQWVKDQLYDVLGISDRYIAEFLIGLSKRATSASDLVQRIRDTGTVDVNDSVVRFAGELYTKVIDTHRDS